MDISARGRTHRGAPSYAAAIVKSDQGRSANGGGHVVSAAELDLKKLLRALQAVRDGDFSDTRLHRIRPASAARSPTHSTRW